MNDSPNGALPPNPEPVQDAGPQFTTSITAGLTADGQFSVHGAIGNEIAALGILAKGADMVRLYHRQQEELIASQKRGLVVPNG